MNYLAIYYDTLGRNILRSKGFIEFTSDEINRHHYHYVQKFRQETFTIANFLKKSLTFLKSGFVFAMQYFQLKCATPVNIDMNRNVTIEL